MLNTYAIDPVHSSVQFSIRHLMISNVRGTFKGVKGTVTYDPDSLAASGITADIDVSTINTQDEGRDAHLKGADFFETEKYPTMKFVSKQIEKIGDGEFRVTGDLTLHGVTKPVVLSIDEVAPESKDPWGNIRIAASAKGKINRKDFGLTWSAPLEAGGVVVGDDVKIELDVQAVKQASTAA
jgi:polyisoprenoid-binding protein YceI